MDQITKQKIAMWEEKLAKLQAELSETIIKRGEAAQMGDLRENAAYQQLTELAEVTSARIADMQKMIEDLKTRKK